MLKLSRAFWFLFGVANLRKRATGRSAEEPVAKSSTEQRRQEWTTEAASVDHGRGRRELFAASLLIVAAVLGWSAWHYLPEDQTPPDPGGGVIIELAGTTWETLEAAEVDLFHIQANYWQLAIRLQASDPEPEPYDALVLRNVEVAPCEVFSDKQFREGPYLRDECERTKSRPGYDSDYPIIPLNWTGPYASTFTRPGGSDASIYVSDIGFGGLPIRAYPHSIGIVESGSQFVVSLPRITSGGRVFPRDEPSHSVPIFFSLATDLGPPRQWTGVAPSFVDETSIGWDYESTGELSIVRGIDPTIQATDQKSSFIAGSLASLAAGTLIAGVERLIGVVPRRRRDLDADPRWGGAPTTSGGRSPARRRPRLSCRRRRPPGHPTQPGPARLR